MRQAVLACATVEAELRPLLPPDVELRVMEQGLHRAPDRLRERLQQEIETIDADEILLGYGLCGNGVVGLVSRRARLILPRVDDCISILLGSSDRYREEFRREPGTYWLSHGWIEHGENPYTDYQRCLQKWDEATARWVAGELLKGYRRLVLIDTGACPVMRIRGYAMEFAAFFGLRYEEMKGGDCLLRALLSAEERDDRFVVIEPGHEISAELFGPAMAIAEGAEP